MLPEYIQRTKDKELRKSRVMESIFFNEAVKKGYKIKKSNPRDDMYKHIDFYINMDDKWIGVDVKARKRTHRRSNSFDDVYTWVEFKNVQGRKGWLYGESDYIVFEQEKEYIFVDRKCLLNYCLDAVEKVNVNSPIDAIYKYYSRNGRQDLLSRIELKKALDSKYFSEPPMVWEKSNDESNN